MMRSILLAVVGSCGALLAADIPALADDLSDGDVDRRIAVARQLADCSSGLEPAVPALAKALRDPYWDVRMAASTALTKAGATALPALADALGHEHYYPPLYAARSAGEMGPQAAALAPLLVAQLEAEDGEHRRWAAWALTRLGPVDGVDLGPAVRLLAAAPTGALADHIALFLGNQGRSDAALRQALIAAALAGNGPAVQACGRLGRPALDQVLAHARQEENRRVIWRCIELCQALAAHGETAVPWLQEELAKRRDPWFVTITANALGAIGAPAAPAVPDLIIILAGYERGDARLAAAMALKNIAPEDERVRAALAAAAKDDQDAKVRAAAAP